MSEGSVCEEEERKREKERGMRRREKQGGGRGEREREREAPLIQKAFSHSLIPWLLDSPGEPRHR